MRGSRSGYAIHLLQQPCVMVSFTPYLSLGSHPWIVLPQRNVHTRYANSKTMACNDAEKETSRSTRLTKCAI
jgi:hypothetical protein